MTIIDLERTLISDAMNREPRPGLRAFLAFCQVHFERIVLHIGQQAAG